VKKAKKVRKMKRQALPSPGSRRCMIYGGIPEEQTATTVAELMTRSVVADIYGIPEALLPLPIAPRRWDSTMIYQDSGTVRSTWDQPSAITVELPPGTPLH
jgi:hypothetical protein